MKFLLAVLTTLTLIPSTGVAQPQLRIARTGTNVVVAWPAAYPRFDLQTSVNLGDPLAWTNYSALPANTGSEFAVTISATNSLGFFRLFCVAALIDVPDPNYFDANCDGIDGNAASAVFVAAAPFGNDAAPGTRQQPVATIEKGIQNALALGKTEVYVARGTYTSTNSLVLSSGISLYGQYDGTTNWYRAGTNDTVINGRSTAVVASNLTAETHFEGFRVMAASATGPGQSSYGVRVAGGTGSLFVRYNTILAGAGMAGSPGSSGPDGALGIPGGNGGGGSCDGAGFGAGGLGGTSACGRSGGNGGRGGLEGSNPGVAGSAGIIGTPGGSGGGGGNPGGRGVDGSNGASGPNGTNGASGPAFGLVQGAVYLPGSGGAGSDGALGHGGGGGGGGGGQGCIFCNDGSGNGGGGGGGGGCGGVAGMGGSGGGGSFGIFIAGASVTVDGNNIVTQGGGSGGRGGNGGIGRGGGDPGAGGTTCTGEVGGGGNGGRGGNGGASGSGAGGAGGPSIGVLYRTGSPVSLSTNTFTQGQAGSGGTGGSNAALGSASSGPAGISGNVFAAN